MKPKNFDLFWGNYWRKKIILVDVWSSLELLKKKMEQKLKSLLNSNYLKRKLLKKYCLHLNPNLLKKYNSKRRAISLVLHNQRKVSYQKEN